jgi:transposase
MTYSLDFRQKVLAIKEQEGLTGKETAVRFGVGVASITRWEKCLEPIRIKLSPASLSQQWQNTPNPQSCPNKRLVVRWHAML